jgi:cobalt-zinc-cadmium resistance protein CzcA
MLNTIIKFSINNKLIIGLFVLGLIIWGAWSLRQLPIDAVPDITNNQVQVITSSPSLAAQEVERLITFPVEQVMSTIPELDQVRSISRFGLSVVTIVFHDDVDIYWARQQVNEKLAEARNNIPATLGNPEISPISTGLGEIYQYVISAQPGFEKKYDARELRTIQDWIVRRQLLGTPGVAEVNSFGGLLKQFEIGLDPEKLRSYNLSITDIFTALELNNRNAGGAYIDKKPTAYFIRTEGLVSSLDDINKIVVKNTAGGLPVLIRDVATVQLGSSIRYGALTRTTENANGEAVGGIVMMLKGANANQVVKEVKSRIDRIARTLPDGVIIEPFLDRSALVDRAIGTVAKNLIEGALIVIFVLVVFLGNLRAGLIVASVIPLAMLFAISMMNLFGVSGNLMSLGAIDFGLIVDGAVIIVEATMHHLGLRNKGRLNQPEMDEEVYASAVKIRSAAAFGEIIILIVYLPILALVGIEGKMFRPMAQTVSFAILGAFILSLTYVPMISALFLSKNTTHKETFSDRMMSSLHKWYHPLIKAAISKKWWVVGTATGLLAISIFIFTRMGGEFIPSLEEGDFAVETRLLTGSSLSQTIDKVTQASAILVKQFPEVKEVVGKIGAAEIPTDPMPMESCDLTIVLKEHPGNREELAERMSKALELVPGVTFGFSQPIQLRSNELISGVRQDVGIKIFGDDLDVLTSLSKKVGKIAAGVAGAKDLYLEQVEGLPQIIVRINRDRIAQYGLNVESVNQAVTAAFAGQSAGLVYEGEQRYDMVVRFIQQNRQSITDVKNIYVTAPTGIQLPLDQLADITFEPGPNQIQREDTKRRIIVGLNVRGRDIQSVVNEIQERIDQQIKLPTGYYITYGGQFENLRAASARLSVAVPVALALILLLLYFTFNSVKQSLLIFTAIPMAAIGGIFALLLRGMPFSISAGVGFIALFGVAVLNGIVLITEFNRLKKENNYSLPEIVLKGTEVRLRPVLMTATVASLGFLPMAISTAAGAEVQKPLATVVIGGLLTSTLLTLIVLPVLYIIFESWKPKPRVLLPLLLLLFTLPASSQSITMDDAVAMAIRNNQGLKSTTLEVSRQQALRGTATEIGKTSVEVMYGQFNSARRDNNITISQGIPYPGVFRNRALLADARIEGASKSVAVSRNDLTYQVRSAYTQLSFCYALQAFLLQQDSIFGNFQKASALRYETGETTLLESTTAQTQYNEVRNQWEKNQADIRSWKAELQRLLNTTDSITLTTDAFKPDRQVLPQIVDTNPVIAQQQQQIVIADKTIRLERSLAAPDFTIGYFNQSIIGTQDNVYYGAGKRFQGVQAGIAIPLFYKPYAARISAAKIEKQQAATQLDFFRTNLTGEYSQATQELLKNARSIDYYEKSALPNADLIRQQAQLAFQNGEIGYVELLQSLKTSSDIRLGYLQAIHLYNQSVYRIKYLAGI